MNIYVGNLSSQTTEFDIHEAFSKFGEVISVTLMDDRYIGSGQPRCYAFVAMASKSESVEAIANLNGKKLKDNAMAVKEALPLSPNDNISTVQTKYNRHYNPKTRERWK